MEFYEQYPEFSKLSIKCGYFDTYVKIINMFVGSGGSNNVIMLGKLKYNNKMVAIKIIPFLKKIPGMIERDSKDQNEIKFYDILTDDIILNKISPHIVGMYKYRHCDDISKILPKTCLSIEDSLFRTENISQKHICSLYKLLLDNLIDKQYDILLLEYCPVSLSNKIDYVSQQPINKIVDFLDRILFQIIFTLAHIYKKYPSFQHGDFFIRNILGIDVNNYNTRDYFEYTYEKYKFYVPVNGYHVKITDFGLSRLDIIPIPKYFLHAQSKDIDHISDMFNILHDIYDGQQLGSESLMPIVKKSKRQAIRNYFKKFINVDYIDRFNDNNKLAFDSIWNISSYQKIIKATKIKEPKLYFDLFVDKYSKLPSGCKVLETFGDFI